MSSAPKMMRLAGKTYLWITNAKGRLQTVPLSELSEQMRELADGVHAMTEAQR